MKPFWDRILNVGLVFSFFIFLYSWPIMYYVPVFIVACIIVRISQIQWEHSLLLKGDFVLYKCVVNSFF